MHAEGSRSSLTSDCQTRKCTVSVWVPSEESAQSRCADPRRNFSHIYPKAR